MIIAIIICATIFLCVVAFLVHDYNVKNIVTTTLKLKRKAQPDGLYGSWKEFEDIALVPGTEVRIGDCMYDVSLVPGNIAIAKM